MFVKRIFIMLYNFWKSMYSCSLEKENVDPIRTLLISPSVNREYLH